MLKVQREAKAFEYILPEMCMSILYHENEIVSVPTFVTQLCKNVLWKHEHFTIIRYKI